MFDANHLIKKVVYDFYAKATVDVIIGYHFQRISDFNQHLPKIEYFWQLQLLPKNQRDTEMRVNFDLIKIHQPLKFTTGQLNRWIILFQQTLEDQRNPSNGAFINKWLKKINDFKTHFLTNPKLFLE